MPKNWYPASSVTGSEGSLDAIDGSLLFNEDRAYIIDDPVRFYVLNETSGATPDPPRIVAPTTNAGDKRWELVGQVGKTGEAGTDLNFGDPVCIDGSGKVKTALSFFGNEPSFESSDDTTLTTMQVTSYDPVEEVAVFAYLDSANQDVLAVAATVNSEGEFSFGTPVEIHTSTYARVVELTYDPASGNHVLFFDEGATIKRSAMVISVSGTTVTAGSPVEVMTAAGKFYGTSGSVLYAAAGDGKVVAVWRDENSPNYAKYVVCTVTGTTLTLGTVGNIVEFNASPSIAYDSDANRFVICYSMSARLAYISGDDLVIGDSVSMGDFYIAMGYNSTHGKVIFGNTGGASGSKVRLGEISGDTLTLGTAVTLSDYTSGSSYVWIVTNDVTNLAYIFYRDKNDNKGKVIVADISGDSISLTESTGILVEDDSSYPRNDRMNTKFLGNINAYNILYWASSYVRGLLYVQTLTMIDHYYWAGISMETVLSGESITFAGTGDIFEGLTGLTPGAIYYLQSDGTLSTTWTPQRFGKAITATALLIGENEAPYRFEANALTGGAEGAVDAIDGDLLSDGAVVRVVQSNIISFYVLDADSGLDADPPNVIIPVTNPGTKRWILSSVVANKNWEAYSDVEPASPPTVVNSTDCVSKGEGNQIVDSEKSTILYDEWGTIKGSDYASILSPYYHMILGGGWNALNGGDSNILTAGGYDNVISGGYKNKIFGNDGFIGAGNYNEIGSDYCIILGGMYGKAYLEMQKVQGFGYFSQFDFYDGNYSYVGDAQASETGRSVETTDATPTVVATDLIPYGQRLWKFKISVAALQTGGTGGTVGDAAFWEITGGLKRTGGTAAQGTLTLAGDQTDGDTITICGETFTFVDRDVPGYQEILIDGGKYDIQDMINLNLSDFYAETSGANDIVVTSKNFTADDNALSFTESATNITMDGSGNFGGTTAGVDSTVALVGTPQGMGVPGANDRDAGAAAWDVTVTANNTDKRLDITVTGEADKTIHWVAKLELVEVG